jgi:UMF1 family MFS transporter
MRRAISPPIAVHAMRIFDPAALNPGVRPREVFAWAGYDFANSGYTTVVLTAVFNAYFVGVVAANAEWATFAWTLILGVSNAALMIAMPLIGAYADLRARKKWLLALSTAGCIAATAALAAVGPGDLVLAALAIAISNFFFMTGVALVAAFLPELARPDALGKVSGWGWGFGYVGGLITLALCLAYVQWAQAAGSTAQQFVPMTMLITATVFALAAAPALLLVRERGMVQADEQVGHFVAQATARLAHTLRHIGKYRDFGLLLLCGLCYQAGVMVVIALAAIYAQEVMKFSFVQTMTLVLVVNVTAAIGAFAFGYVQDAIGHKLALGLTLLLWLAMVAVAATATSVAMFWLAANLAGLAMGSSQSAGRAMAGLFAPRDRLAEFYGLWTFATQLAAIVGPVSYGAVVFATANNHRLAIGVTGLFFVGGLIALAGIDVARGRRSAE